MRTPRAVNSLIDDVLRENIERLVRKKNALGFFISSGFLLQYRDAGKGVLISGVLRSVGSYHMYVFANGL